MSFKDLNKPQKTSMFRDIFASTGDGKASISKLTMLIGLIACTFIVVHQAVTVGISYDLFTTYIISTLGANSVNKALAVIQNVQTEKFSQETEQVKHTTQHHDDVTPKP